MGRQILFVLTSHGLLGDTGNRTGTWLEELAVPYFAFVDSGHTVTLASIVPATAPMDPMSLDAPWITKVGQRFLDDERVQAQLRTTPGIASIDPARFDALYLVGGAGAVWDFPENTALGNIVASVSRAGVIGAICHGVSGLLNPVAGTAFAKGRALTAITNAEDEMGGFDKIVPVLPETALKAVGASFSAAAPFQSHVIQDGRLVTGQNPASAGPLAARMLQALQ